MEDREIVYLKHPLSYEDKMKWIDRGYRVDDLKRAPKGYKNPDQKKAKPKKAKKEK